MRGVGAVVLGWMGQEEGKGEEEGIQMSFLTFVEVNSKWSWGQ